jgi:hypothetical protein
MSVVQEFIRITVNQGVFPMKKTLCTVFAIVIACSLVSCKKTVKGLDGTWISNSMENGRSTLVVNGAGKDSFNFYLESEKNAVFRKIEGEAKFKKSGAVYVSGKDGFEIKFSFVKDKDRVSKIRLKGTKDGAFFDGEYDFVSASVEKPQKVFKIADGFYCKSDPDKKVTLDVMLENGVMRERTLENGEVMGGREIGSFRIVANDIIVSTADSSSGQSKEEIWKALDDKTIKSPDGTVYTFYQP